MASQFTPTLEPLTIERLQFPTAPIYIGKRWITTALTASGTDNTRECIPKTIESVETLQYLGLTQSAASEAFGVFTQKSEITVDIDIEFVTWAKRHVEKFPDCSREDAASVWDDVMRTMGLQHLWRNAILDPRFAIIRQEHTAKYWVIQTMEEKWKQLIELDQRMKSDLAKIEAGE